MQHAVPALRMLIFMTVLTGVVYPLSGTLLAQLLFPHKANGSLVLIGGQVVGSSLIAQKFEGPKYFWPRPSAGDYNPLPSGGSNQGQISADLKKAVDERRAKLAAAHPGMGEPPQDLLFASASGLDPHISPAAARFQMRRVAEARGLTEQRLGQLVESKIERRQFGLFGELRINVLELNLALDQL